MDLSIHPDTTPQQLQKALDAADTPPDTFLDLPALIAISQCNPRSWRATGCLVGAIAERKGAAAIGLGNGQVFMITEWDDRDFVHAPLQ